MIKVIQYETNLIDKLTQPSLHKRIIRISENTNSPELLYSIIKDHLPEIIRDGFIEFDNKNKLIKINIIYENETTYKILIFDNFEEIKKDIISNLISSENLIYKLPIYEDKNYELIFDIEKIICDNHKTKIMGEIYLEIYNPPLTIKCPIKLIAPIYINLLMFKNTLLEKLQKELQEKLKNNIE